MWARAPDGTLREQRVKYRAGSVIALPEALGLTE